MAVAYSSSALLEPIRDLGVAWMNRGHARMLQGDRAGLEAALHAYHEAVKVLRSLPVAENASWVNTLGAALMNHGQLLHRLHGLEQATLALASFAEAEAILRPLVTPLSPSLSPSPSSPWPRRNLAGSHLNRASLLLDLSRPAEAHADALVALQLVAPHERVDLLDTDLSLKSRRALCDAVGQLIVAPGADQNALAREASDLVDDGLALARHWIELGAPQPRELALRLFRFGAQLYRLHQPHFLGEFILENLDSGEAGTFASDAEFQAIAREVVDSALADELRNGAYLTAGDTATERRSRTWHDLSILRSRLSPPATVC